MKSARMILAVLALTSSVRAQPVADGATNTLANVTTNITGTVTVGTNGSFTLLTLSDNALLTNSAHGVIGRNASALSNEVQLIAPSARWLLGNNLFVGSNGASSRLVVSDGAFVNNNLGSIGHGASSSNNLALVTGAGSLWTNRAELFVGNFGSGNQLIVSNGARAVSALGTVSYQVGSSNNLAVITGSGSIWTNHIDVSVGGNGPGRLIIEAGGQVGADNGTVGSGFFSDGSETLVTGSGSLWSSRTDMRVGLNPANNLLVVSNGASVVAGNNGRIGVSTGSTNNVVLVTGAGSLWSNRFDLFVGESARNRLEIHNGGWVVSSNTYVGLFGGTNVAVISGVGSTLSNRASLTVGDAGAGNQLVVSNGGTVISRGSIYVGQQTASSNNTVIVAGAGSRWDSGFDSILFGSGGGGNQLRITNGGAVLSGQNAVGVALSSINNEVLVTDAGSRWIHTSIAVGQSGSGNRLLITNEGRVFGTAYLHVGENPSSTNNRVVVDGGTLIITNGGGSGLLDIRRGTNVFLGGVIEADRLLLTNGLGRFEFLGGTLVTRGAFNNVSTMTLGQSGGGSAFWDVRPGPSNHFFVNSVLVGNGSPSNQVLVSDGARLTNSFFGIIGSGIGAVGNGATVIGSGSRWETASDMRVGANGGVSNRLTVDGGGLVVSSGGSVGFDITSIGNTATVTGSGSEWRLRNNLEVGSAGSFNQLLVSDGAVVQDTNGILAAFAQSSNNTAVVSGPGSLWSNRLDLIVGWFGGGNQLVVSNGGRVINMSGGTIGSQVGAPNNQITVSGNGSIWNSGSALSVGYAGAGNRLVVEAGGRVESNTGRIGYGGGSSNLALVTGAGSTWSNANLEIGGFGPNNQLIVSNGAAVVGAVDTFLGHDPGASNNVAVVTGAGSLLTNSFDLLVGYQEGRNQLVVSNGGWLVSRIGHLGYFSIADNNLARVTGAGSVWSNRANLNVGFDGSGNRLIVNNGGQVVVNGIGTVGSSALSSSNSMFVAQPGTRLTVGGDFIVGSSGTSNVVELATGASATIGGETRVSGNHNDLIVSDAGTVWTSQGGFEITGAGHNRLVVHNGAVARGFFDSTVAGGPNNEVLVTGPGSLWESTNRIVNVGMFDTDTLVTISDGGVIRSQHALLGVFEFSSNALVNVTGAGAMWDLSGSMVVGSGGPGHRLAIANGGAVVAAGVTVGAGTNSTRNRVTVDGGTLRATNASLTGGLFVQRGTNVLNAGLIDVDRLLLTNAQGFFELNGGTLITRGATISNGGFIFGNNSATPAMWDIRSGPQNHLLEQNLSIGQGSLFKQLLITNGAALVSSRDCFIGVNAGANSNSVILAGGTSRFECRGMGVGQDGAFNRMVVSNGASIITGINGSSIGNTPPGRSNTVVVTGTGSTWSNLVDLTVGSSGSANQLVVSDGGTVISAQGCVGFFASGSNCVAQVTGAGSVWSNGTDFIVGGSGARSQMLISNAAAVFSGGSFMVGTNAASTNNRVVVDNGTLRVTNAAATALLEIRRGTNVLNSGLIEADMLRMTNGAAGKLEINGGTLSLKESEVINGQIFRVGNGVTPATLILAGNGAGSHLFAPPGSLSISANGALTGNGSLGGGLTVQPAGLLSPGLSIGTIALSQLGSPSLQGTILMEISKNGSVLTNDALFFSTTGAFNYGGALIVTNVGPTALANGDRFQLFSAASYAGSFASITLPPLPPPLSWTNKLLLDGSIEVIAPPVIALSSGTYTQNFDSLSMSGSVNPWRDNVTLLGWYAARTVAPTTITNYIASDGSGNAGALYSFGSNGSSERALGSIASDAVGDISYGLGFVNDTATAISNFKISFTAEQWRSSDSLSSNTLTVWYRVNPLPITNPEPGITTNWTQVTNLNFTSPVVLGTGVPLNGSQPSNRQIFSAFLVEGLAVPPGQSVFFRWRDPNDSGSDQGLALDDLMVDFSPLRPQITSILFDPTNSFVHLTGLGDSNVTYGVEAATNFASPIFWERIGTNAANNFGIFQFTDTNAPTFPMRFYRALFP